MLTLLNMLATRSDAEPFRENVDAGDFPVGEFSDALLFCLSHAGIGESSGVARTSFFKRTGGLN